MSDTDSLKALLAAAAGHDTLRYRVLVHRNIRKDTLRIKAKVTALVSTRDYHQAELEERIHAALGRFIEGRWQFYGMKREPDATGYERVTLTACALVPVGENWNLEERARDASREGLSLSGVEVSYASTNTEVDKIVRELRAEVLRHVKDHIDEYSEISGRAWRIGDIVFGISDEDRGYTGKGARRTDSGMDDSIETAEMMDGSERITLRASVELRASLHQGDNA